MVQNPVEKAARSELRKLDSSPEELEILDNGSQAAIVAAHILKAVLPHKAVPLVKEKGPHTLVPISRDEVEARFLGSLLAGLPVVLPANLYLKSVPHAELGAYAKKHGLKHVPLKLTVEEQAAQKMIKEVQAEQGQTEAALLKSIEWIQSLAKKPRKKNE